MTNTQFKKGINSELKAAGMIQPLIKEVKETGVNTTLVFTGSLTMKLIKWLNDRFAYGISLNENDPSTVFINTPVQGKTNIGGREDQLKIDFKEKALKRILSKLNLWEFAILKACIDGKEITYSDLKSQQADNPEMMERMIGVECASILLQINT